MGKRAPHEVAPEPDKALLIGLEMPEDDEPIEDSLDELAALAKTANIVVVDRLSQRRSGVDPSFFLGKGKAEEACELAKGLGANLILVDNDLTPGQQRNLEKITKVSVIDRTELILRIFNDHARTHQARVQVDLAQAQYDLPRLKRLWTHLSREKGGGAFRGGAGERQIELDRRIVRRNITDRKRELEQIRERKQRTMRQRQELFSVALVGYTNAGKSTLMNTLTDAGVLAENKLFATLDTRTRIWDLGSPYRCLLSDTVGFIKKLPHDLVECFHATLEEAIQADLLIHVVDASAKEPERQIEAVHQVLKQLECDDTPTLTVLNKTDRMKDRAGDLQVLKAMLPGAVEISAKKGSGLDELQARIKQIMQEREIEMTLEVDPANGELVSFLRRDTAVLEEAWEEEDGLGHFAIRVDPRHLKKLDELLGGGLLGTHASESLRRAAANPDDPRPISSRMPVVTIGDKDSARLLAVAAESHAASQRRRTTSKHGKTPRVHKGNLPRPDGIGDIDDRYEPMRGVDPSGDENA